MNAILSRGPLTLLGNFENENENEPGRWYARDTR